MHWLSAACHARCSKAQLLDHHLKQSDPGREIWLDGVDTKRIAGTAACSRAWRECTVCAVRHEQLVKVWDQHHWHV